MERAGRGWLSGFLAGSAVLIAAAVFAAGTLAGRFFEHQQLQWERTQTAEVVQTQARQHLAPGDFSGPPAEGAPAPFGAFLGELPGTFRIKVFDRFARVVWSDEPRLIGQSFPDNPHLAKALRGEVATVLEAPERREHVYEREKAHVLEAYVPIRFPVGGPLIGVVETYKDATSLVAGIRQAQSLIWVVSGVLGLVLYAALAAVVGRAARNERRAMVRLEGQHRDLESAHGQVRDAHARLAAIVSGIADRMVMVDRGMRVVWANTVAEQALGHGDRVIGRRCFEVLGTESEACLSCPAVRTFASGVVERGVRTERLADGSVRHLDLVTAPLRDASGEVQQVLEVARDVTEQVDLQNRIKESAERIEQSRVELLTRSEELARANRALSDAQAQMVEKERLAAVGQVVVGLHHAILNPLTGILGALRVLHDETLLPHVRASALADAETEARKIEQLIRRLPDLPHARGRPYVGGTTMLDLDPSARESRSP